MHTCQCTAEKVQTGRARKRVREVCEGIYLSLLFFFHHGDIGSICSEAILTQQQLRSRLATSALRSPTKPSIAGQTITKQEVRLKKKSRLRDSSSSRGNANHRLTKQGPPRPAQPSPRCIIIPVYAHLACQVEVQFLLQGPVTFVFMSLRDAGPRRPAARRSTGCTCREDHAAGAQCHQAPPKCSLPELVWPGSAGRLNSKRA